MGGMTEGVEQKLRVDVGLCAHARWEEGQMELSRSCGWMSAYACMCCGTTDKARKFKRSNQRQGAATAGLTAWISAAMAYERPPITSVQPVLPNPLIQSIRAQKAWQPPSPTLAPLSKCMHARMHLDTGAVDGHNACHLAARGPSSPPFLCTPLPDSTDSTHARTWTQELWTGAVPAAWLVAGCPVRSPGHCMPPPCLGAARRATTRGCRR
eukprot:352712-Chlamydomonas_euryale.AAC.1